MIDLYYQSVGRGANLLLNVPPNRDGLLSAEDVASLKAFGDYRRKTFGEYLAKGAKRSGAPEIVLDFGHHVTFNVIRVKEDIRYGQRIDAFAVEQWVDGKWDPIATATSVGPRRLIKLEKPATAARLRLNVTQSAAAPIVSESAVFAE